MNYMASPNRVLSNVNGIDYAYRDIGEGTPPLVLLQHFRGNLDNWDPALVDALATERRVVTFDNGGVGGSRASSPTRSADGGELSCSSTPWVREVDLLGFSIGSFVAQEIALIRPGVVSKFGPRVFGPAGRRRHARLGARGDRGCGHPTRTPTGTSASSSPARRPAGRWRGRPWAGWTRPNARSGQPTTWQTRQAQYDAVCDWGIPDHGLLQRVSAIDMPVFVANGDSDPMILPNTPTCWPD